MKPVESFEDIYEDVYEEHAEMNSTDPYQDSEYVMLVNEPEQSTDRALMELIEAEAHAEETNDRVSE